MAEEVHCRRLLHSVCAFRLFLNFKQRLAELLETHHPTAPHPFHGRLPPLKGLPPLSSAQRVPMRGSNQTKGSLTKGAQPHTQTPLTHRDMHTHRHTCRWPLVAAWCAAVRPKVSFASTRAPCCTSISTTCSTQAHVKHSHTHRAEPLSYTHTVPVSKWRFLRRGCGEEGPREEQSGRRGGGRTGTN